MKNFSLRQNRGASCEAEGQGRGLARNAFRCSHGGNVIFCQSFECANHRAGNDVLRQDHQPHQRPGIFDESGKFAWTVIRPDGQQTTITGSLQPLNAGEFSYQILIPHEALAYGVSNSSSVIPMPVQQVICTNIQITVDGSAASIMAPGSSSFAVAQSLRASTYRLDLEVGNPLPDTIGDGIPDWWKNKFGIIDPNADPDGDGWTNLQEFLHGSNPNQDNRIPSIATSEVFVYADGSTGIRLNAIDSDSQPTNLFYSLTALPQGGTFYLQKAIANSTNSAIALTNGSSFTQDDVNKGRLIFVHQGRSQRGYRHQFWHQPAR